MRNREVCLTFVVRRTVLVQISPVSRAHVLHSNSAHSLHNSLHNSLHGVCVCLCNELWRLPSVSIELRGKAGRLCRFCTSRQPDLSIDYRQLIARPLFLIGYCLPESPMHNPNADAVGFDWK